MHSNGALGLGAGPAGDVLGIVETLKEEGVFAREVDTLGLAFHSPALDPLLPELTQGRALGVIGSCNPVAVQSKRLTPARLSWFHSVLLPALDEGSSAGCL